MKSDKPLLVFRPLSRASSEQVAKLHEQVDGLRQALDASEQPVVFVQDVAVYWLRPGDSTVEMDARAEQIRASLEPLTYGVESR